MNKFYPDTLLLMKIKKQSEFSGADFQQMEKITVGHLTYIK